MASQREFSLLVKIMGSMDPSLLKASNLTKKQLAAIKGEVDAIDKVLWGGITTVAKAGLAVATAAGAATIAAGKKAVDVGSEFEKAMSQWAAVSDASVAEYNRAEAAALKWGRQTTKTATEGAEALTYMATAGWDVERSVEALPKVLKLAEATNLDLAHTSDLVANAMAATGSEAEDLGRMLDIAAKANNKSNQTAEQLLLAWRKTGANLDNLHVDIAESATAIGMLANRGKKAEEAGTALNAVLINMTTGAGQAGKMMEKLGLTAFDEQGNFKGLKQIFTELNDATKDLSDEERNQAFAMLGGKRQVEALTDIMSGLNHVLEDGSTEWDRLYESLTDADGALEKMAARRMDNLWGDVKILESALQDAGIRAYKGFADPLRDAAQMATEAVYQFSENVSDKIGEWYVVFRNKVYSAAADLSGFGGTLLELGRGILKNGDKVAGVLMGIASAITAFHVAWGAVKGVAELHRVLGLLNLGLGTVLGPLGAFALGIGAAGAAVTYMTIRGKKLKDANLKKHFGDIALSMDQINKAARHAIGDKYLEKLDYTISQFDKGKDIAENIKSAAQEIDRISWKVGEGIELDGDDLRSLGDNITTMVNQAVEYAEQHRYQMHVALDMLFGDGESEGKSIFEGISASLAEEVQQLGQDLGTAYSNAIADGIISSDEMSLIEELTAKLERVTQGAQAAIDDAEWTLHEVDMSKVTPETAMEYARTVGETTQAANEKEDVIFKQTVGPATFNRGRSESGELTPGMAGYISADDYETGMNAAIAARNEKQEANLQKATELTLGGFKKAYQQEYQDFLSGIPEAIETAIEQSDMGNTGEVPGILENMFLGGKDQQEAIGELVKAMEPTVDQLEGLKQSYEDAGKEIPSWLAQGLHDADALAAMSGDMDAFLRYIGEEAMSDDKFAPILKIMQENGKLLPPELSKAVEANKDKVDTGVNSLYSKLDESLKAKFAAGMNVEVPIRFNLVPEAKEYTVAAPKVTAQPAQATVPSGRKHALGGIVTRPEYSLIGEAGYPEAVIPINNSRRASALFEETGRMLNAAGANVGGSGGPAYAPTISIVVNGRADEGTIRGALRSSYDEWLGYAQRYQRDQARLAY